MILTIIAILTGVATASGIGVKIYLSQRKNQYLIKLHDSVDQDAKEERELLSLDN